MDGVLLPLLLFAVVMSFTPGPNIVLVTASAANFGFRRSFPHILGVTLGFPVMLVAVGLGLGAAFQAAPRLHLAMKYAGAAYLLYFAWRIATAAAAEGKPGGRPFTFLQAALFQWINPKAWVIAVGAVSTYTTVGGDMLAESLAIAAIFVLACFPALALWAGMGAGIGRLLGAPRARAAFNWTMAGFLALSLVPVFW